MPSVCWRPMPNLRLRVCPRIHQASPAWSVRCRGCGPPRSPGWPPARTATTGSRPDGPRLRAGACPARAAPPRAGRHRTASSRIGRDAARLVRERLLEEHVGAEADCSPSARPRSRRCRASAGCPATCPRRRSRCPRPTGSTRAPGDAEGLRASAPRMPSNTPRRYSTAVSPGIREIGRRSPGPRARRGARLEERVRPVVHRQQRPPPTARGCATSAPASCPCPP